MSPVNNFAILALAASTMAIPQHGYQHKRYHESASGSASAVSRYSHSGSRHPHSYSGSVRASKSGHKSSASAKATAPAGYTGISRASAPGTISAADVAPSATSTCTDDVTVTSIENVTVYVTESAGAPASSSESAAAEVTTSAASSEEVASSSSSEVSLAATGARYGGWGSHSGWQHESASTEAAAPTTSSTVAPTYQATTFSSQVVPATTAPTSTYVPSTSVWSATIPAITVPSVAVPSVVSSIVSSVVSSVVSVATSAAAAMPSSYGGSTSKTGKRGLAYNDASLTDCFAGSSEISWAYNWGSDVNGTLPSGITYLPTLWGDADYYTKVWKANAQKAIDNGAKTLFSFNEPDQEGQAYIPASQAASAYSTWMTPFQNKASLCAPAVTNGGGDMGLNYLKSFLASCTNCQIDCFNIHWYDSATNIAYFKQHIQDTIALAGGKPIYVTEFGATGTDAQISTFLDEVMPYMDGIDQIAGYAYFMVENGVLVTGNEPSTYGKVYMAAN